MGLDFKLKFHTKEVVAAIESTATQRVLEAVNVVRGQALETLSGSRSGRTYRVPGSRRTYTASAPGEPPASRLGELRQSVKIALKTAGRKIIGMVGTALEYGKVLEFGTRDGRIAPRPWLRISFEKAQPKVKAIFSRKWF